MVEKTPSSTSLGFSDTETEPESLAFTSQPLPYGQYLYDVSVFAIKCPHNKIPLHLVRDKSALWLPFEAINVGKKWIQSTQDIEEQFISDQIPNVDERSFMKRGFIETLGLVSISRLQLPTEEFISRDVFCAKWKSDSQSKVVCCKNSRHFEWHPITDIIDNKITNLWGNEVLEFIPLLNKSDEELKSSPILIQELTNKSIYRFLSIDVKNATKEDRIIVETLKAVNVNRKVMEKLYSDFIQHCYPSSNMSFISYNQYMTQIELKGVDERMSGKGFIAMNYAKTGFLSYDEFLLGLVALEPKSLQNELRLTYIFRYYDTNQKGVLERNDIRDMVIDMNRLQKKVIDNNAIEVETDRIMNIPDITNDKKQITYQSLLSKVQCEELRPLPVLFRALESLHKLISDKNIYEPIGKASKALSKEQLSGFCPKHRRKDFNIAIHSSSMKADGLLSDPKDIRMTDGKDIKFEKGSEFVENLRSHSIKLVNRFTSYPNLIIDVIRELVGILNKTDISQQSKRDFRISTTEKLKFSVIEEICHEIQKMFQMESRVLKVQSPTFVLGDIHANIKDLLIFEEQLWRSQPQVLPSNLIFIGDLVDRGEDGIECVLYLYSLKILNPNQVFLLRGNHEIRSVQKNFTFEKECNEKYKKDGQKVFELFNQTFDVMPIAAVIDETLFCVHGGIPHSLHTIDELMRVPIEIREPEKECPAVWEMLWSDPLNKEDYENLVKFNKIENENGFINNKKRSTAYYFSDKALTAFLRANRLSHVIRTHEVVDDGYKLLLGGRVITVFSSSGIRGFKNKAAALHINGTGNKGIIKIVILNDPNVKKKDNI